MDFIRKNKILTVMALIALLSFALEKTGVIHPWNLLILKNKVNHIKTNEINIQQE